MTTPLSHIEHKAAAILMFVAALVFSFPESSLAASPALTGNSSLVFELKQNALENIKPSSLTIEEVKQNDILIKKLRAYLEAKGSPLAIYAAQIVEQPQWPRALAISWQESQFGKYCHSNNCSGIGGSPSQKSWRKYETKLDWFKDMSALMEKPIYSKKYTDCKKMNGVYNAGSKNWEWSCIQKSQELLDLIADAEQERIALVSQGSGYTNTQLAIAQ